MLDWLFRRKSAAQRQVDDIFERLTEFLSDDERQNAVLPDEVRELLESGPDVDELPGALGEFGRDPGNPIPVNGPIGEVLYLSSLSLDESGFIFAHRLGSKGRIDVFETVNSDGRMWDLLLLSLYHPRKSRKVPSGYHLRPAATAPFVCASNIFVPDFPHKMGDAISEWTRSTLGIPLVSREIRNAIEEGTFARPAEHAAKVEALKLDGKMYEPANTKVPLLLQHVEDQAEVIATVLERNVGCGPLKAEELLYFCAATASYAYLNYSRGKPDERMIEEFSSELAANSAKRSVTYGQALQEYRKRYAEYAALYDALFQEGKDVNHKRHWFTTVMMHLVERATGRSAEGYMIKISINSSVIAAMFDDAFKLARGQLSN